VKVEEAFNNLSVAERFNLIRIFTCIEPGTPPADPNERDYRYDQLNYDIAVVLSECFNSRTGKWSDVHKSVATQVVQKSPNKSKRGGKRKMHG
jgi:hypothetical protein